jgi:NADH-quinone oxidoreductase subunit A
MPDYVPIAITLALGVGFTAFALFLARLISPNKPKAEKLTTYECGERPVGQAWSQFNVRFYIFALMFVVFDVETVFVFPWAVRLYYFRGLGPQIALFLLIEMIVFIVILVLGLAYAWRKGVLKWV